MAEYDGSIRINTEIDTKNATAQLVSFQNRMVKTADKIAEITKKMDDLKNVQTPTKAFEELGAELKKAQDELDELIKKEESMPKVGSSWEELVEQQAKASDKIDEIKAKMQSMKDSGTAYIDPTTTDQWTKLSQQLTYAQNDMELLKMRVEEYQEKTKNMDKSNGLAKSLKQAQMFGDALKSVVKVAKKVGGAFASLGAKVFGVFKKMGSNLTEHFSNPLQRVMRMAKRVFVFAVLTKALRALRTAFTEGIKGYIQYDKALATSMNELKASASTLKASVGAAFAPLLSAVVPILKTIISWITEAVNKINQLISALTGKNTWQKAVTGVNDYATGASNATKANNKLLKSLMGFDKLNVIGKDDDSSGSGAGGSGSGSASYITEPIENSISTLATKIKQAMNSGEWSTLGEYVRDKFISLLDINWSGDVFPKAAGFANGLATFLNGLFAPDKDGNTVLGAVGETIGNAIKTALTFLNTFGLKFNWSKFGDSIRQGIDNFFNTNILAIGAGTIATYLNGLVDTIYAVVSKKSTWKNLGTKIGDGINAFFTKTNWQKLGKTISASFKAITTAIKTALDTVKWEKVGKAIGDFIAGIDWKGVFTNLWGLAKALIKAIGEAIKGLAKSDGGWIAGAIVALIGAISIAKNAFAGTTLSSTLGTALSSTLGTIGVVVGVAITGFNFGKSLYENNEFIQKSADNEVKQFFAGLDKIRVAIGLDPKYEVEEPSQEHIDETTRAIERQFAGIKLKKALNVDVEFGTTDIAGWTDEQKELIRQKLQEYNGDLDKFIKDNGLNEYQLDEMVKIGILNKKGDGTYEVAAKSIQKGVNDELNKKPVTVGVNADKDKISKAKTAIQNGIKDTTAYIKFGAMVKKQKYESFKDAKTALTNHMLEGMPSYIEEKIKAKIDKDSFSDLGKVAGKEFYNGFNKNSLNIGKLGANGMPTNVMSKIGGAVITKKARGGLLEDGLFTMNKGEILGSFFGGKSAVANNFQIINGIAKGVELAVKKSFMDINASYNTDRVAQAQSNNMNLDAMSSLVAQKIQANVTFKVEGDPNGLFKVVQDKAQTYYRSTRQNALVF